MSLCNNCELKYGCCSYNAENLVPSSWSMERETDGGKVGWIGNKSLFFVLCCPLMALQKALSLGLIYLHNSRTMWTTNAQNKKWFAWTAEAARKQEARMPIVKIMSTPISQEGSCIIALAVFDWALSQKWAREEGREGGVGQAGSYLSPPQDKLSSLDCRNLIHPTIQRTDKWIFLNPPRLYIHLMQSLSSAFR